jgi:hypothetical protein
MGILVGKNTRLLVQGITGREDVKVHFIRSRWSIMERS